MNVEIFMPKMGESITEGRILKWLKKPGDQIDRDETILEIATDKVDTEVPSPAGGIVVQLLFAEGDTVEVGKVIAIVETDAASAVVKDAPGPMTEASAAPAEEQTPPREQAETVRPVAAAPTESTAIHGKKFYSPVVMRIAAEQGVPMSELESLTGSGAGGRVTKADIFMYLDTRKAAAQSITSASPGLSQTVMDQSGSDLAGKRGEGVDVVPMDNMHRLMAEHMVRSKQISPHVALVADIDLTRIVKYRDMHADAFKNREGISLTFMPFIAHATVQALKDFPFVNASIEGTDILLKRFIHLGIAVAMDGGGLIVPVVKHAETLNLVGLARGIADVATRARKKKLQPDEIQDGTFTITNFGVFGSTFGLPIINQPQVAILGVGALQKKPVVIEQDGADMIAIRSVIQLSLSFDHRIVDGALGGRFLEKVKHYLEEFRFAAL